MEVTKEGKIEVYDKNFEIYISSEKIKKRVSEMAEEILAEDFPENTLFVGILRGAFIFMADLMREMDKDYKSEFVRLQSYQGMESGELEIGKHAFDPSDYEMIVLVEDIIDTGNTLSNYKNYLNQNGAKNIKIVSLLRKPSAITENVEADFVGFDIPEDFVIGYGMDYGGYGRSLEHIYQHIE